MRSACPPYRGGMTPAHAVLRSSPRRGSLTGSAPAVVGVVPALSTPADPRLKAEIFRLQKERGAVILAHNYQNPEIYEVADFIGDSLGLSASAMRSEAEVIMFCGVHFMAESAAILNPGKTVLLPRLDAGCGMADMVTARDLRGMKERHPGAAVVCYVNSSAAVKAESDICCTSSNALEVVRSLPEKRILFVPDKNLARYVQGLVPEKEIIPWEGWCPIHHELKAADLAALKAAHPHAEIVAHPECQEDMLSLADSVTSTTGMLDLARRSPAKEFIFVTECGMANMLRREVPGKTFLPVCSICPDMKKIGLADVRDALLHMKHRITVPESVAERARLALERMMAVKPAPRSQQSPGTSGGEGRASAAACCPH